MRYWILVILLVVSSAHAEVYRWVDGDGNVVFSDKPHPNAQKIDIPQTPSYKPVPIPDTATPPQATETKPQDAVPNYQLTILSPADNKSFWANDGRVNVTLQLEPKLDDKRGDKFVVQLDGQAVGEPQKSPQFVLTDVYRGAHELEAAVVDAAGHTLDSAKVTFFIHRATVKQFQKHNAPN